MTLARTRSPKLSCLLALALFAPRFRPGAMVVYRNTNEQKKNPKTKKNRTRRPQGKTQTQNSKIHAAEKYPLENAETMEPSPAVDGPGGGGAIASRMEGGFSGGNWGV